MAGFGGGVPEETPAATIAELIDGTVDEMGGANIAEPIPSGSIVPNGQGVSVSLKR